MSEDSPLPSETNDLFRALLDNLSDSIYFKDLNSKFTVCNESQAKVLGAQSVQELIGKSDADFFGPLHSEKAKREEQELMETGKPISNMLEQVDYPDGSHRWHLSSKAPLIGASGAVIGMLGITKDVTEFKLTQDRLIEAQNRLSEQSRNAGRAEIASIVIHNVGNMLNSVNVTTEMINQLSKQRSDLDLGKLGDSIQSQLENPTMELKDFVGKVASYLKTAAKSDQNAEHELREEVENLKLDISRMQKIISVQQGLVAHMREGQYRSWLDVVEDAIEINKLALDRHQVHCSREFSASETIQIPEFQVLQILLNFISNSKYSYDSFDAAKREIRIGVYEKEDHLNIDVSDFGSGIPIEIIESIFELGFSTREEGHGIGLHGSKMAAKEINSTIAVKSEGHQKGATFTLSIPFSECRFR